MTPIEGVDYSYARPDPAKLAAAGKRFAIRYVTPPGKGAKGVDQAEFDALRAAGISVVAVWEGGARDPLKGRAQGVRDAKAAQAGLDRIVGLPDRAPVYFAVDWDATPADMAGPVASYFQGAASVLGTGRVGAYGGRRQLDYLHDKGLAAWWWQTYAWSGATVAPYIHLHQYRNGVPLAGGTVDLVRALQPEYGQHAVPTTGEPTVPATPTPLGTVRLTRPRQRLEDVTCARVVVQAPDVVIVGCTVTGDPTLRTEHGLVDFTHQAASGTVTDTHVQPAVPTLWQTGVLGHDYTATRVTVRHTVDGFGVYNTHKPADGRVDVTIDRCDVDELGYFVNDPTHADRHSHSDAVQIQGGSHVTIRNSKFHAFVGKFANWAKDPYYPASTGQAIAVTPNVAAVTWLHIEGCDLDGGAQSVTIIPGKFGSVKNIGSIVNNTFGRGQANIRKGTVKARRPGIAHPNLGVTWRGNKYADGSEAKLTITRDV